MKMATRHTPRRPRTANSSPMAPSLRTSTPTPTSTNTCTSTTPYPTLRNLSTSTTTTTIPANGYSHLAKLMAAHPETAMFRRFGALEAQNLLYLQAELTCLEEELKRCREKAGTGEVGCVADVVDAEGLIDRDWRMLSEEGTNDEGGEWDIALRIRKVLREYHESLLLSAQVLSHTSVPNPADLAFLQLWMKHPGMGGVYLLGPDSGTWEEDSPTLGDLVALKRMAKGTLFSTLLGGNGLRLWHACVGRWMKKPDPTNPMHGNTVQYSEGTLLRVGILIGTMCASTLPVVTIVVLYFVSDMGCRLAIIGVFTALFSAALGVFTNGRVIEIFSATAAFAAVQVVFVGTTPGSGSGVSGG